MYMLEHAESYIVPTEQLKNRTCQTFRWKQIALSKDINELLKLKKSDMRIIDWNNGEVVVKADWNYR